MKTKPKRGFTASIRGIKLKEGESNPQTYDRNADKQLSDHPFQPVYPILTEYPPPDSGICERAAPGPTPFVLAQTSGPVPPRRLASLRRVHVDFSSSQTIRLALS